jgi:CRP/FNR family cyclic AMP-dependent transcriptional regulator
MVGKMPAQPAPDPFDHPALNESLRALARRGDIRRYRKGTVLIDEGDRGDTIFIILSGRLRAYSGSDKGREITYGVYGPGEYLGEMSLDGGLRSASVITLESSACAIVTRQTLQEHIAEHPEFAFDLLAKVIRRARSATLSAKQMALNGVYGRLVEHLNNCAVGDHDGTRQIEPRMTHRDLAALLGCSREMVSRLMKDLERGGYVSAAGRALRLHRPLPMRW